MDRLAANPSGSDGGIYGMPAPGNDSDTLSIVNRLKDREFEDYKNKARFDDERSLRQESRMRQLFDPNKNTNSQPQINNQAGIIPNILTPDQQVYQQQQLEQPRLDMESKKLDSQNRFGQQGLAIKDAQEKLNETKNNQINQDRDADRERKVNEANQKITVAQKTLEDRTANSAAQLQAHKDMAAAIEERHKLELENQKFDFNAKLTEQKRQFDETSGLHKQQITDAENSQTTTEVNPDGTKKTVTTKKGDAIPRPAPVKNPNGTYHVHGPNGYETDIPADKLDDWNANHQNVPDFKPGGGEQ